MKSENSLIEERDRVSFKLNLVSPPRGFGGTGNYNIFGIDNISNGNTSVRKMAEGRVAIEESPSP